MINLGANNSLGSRNSLIDSGVPPDRKGRFVARVVSNVAGQIKSMIGKLLCWLGCHYWGSDWELKRDMCLVCRKVKRWNLNNINFYEDWTIR